MSVNISGHKEIIEALKTLGIRKAKNVIRASVRAQAADARNRVRAKAPTHGEDVYKKEKSGIDKITKKGTLKRAVRSKDRKPRGNMFQSNVIITEGQNAKNDGYFWKYIEHGTIKQGAEPFIKPVEDSKRMTAESDMKAEFIAKVEQAIQKAIK
jgi:HK97 gp10 family phage protein